MKKHIKASFILASLFVILCILSFSSVVASAHSTMEKSSRPSSAHLFYQQPIQLARGASVVRPNATGCHTSYVTIFVTGGGGVSYSCSGLYRAGFTSYWLSSLAWSGYIYDGNGAYIKSYCNYSSMPLNNLYIGFIYLSPTPVPGC